MLWFHMTKERLRTGITSHEISNKFEKPNNQPTTLPPTGLDQSTFVLERPD